jgi:hypothetical protein
MPAEHVVQLHEPVMATWLFPHARHDVADVEPTLGLYVPAGHTLQDVSPLKPTLYLPHGQMMQLDPLL